MKSFKNIPNKYKTFNRCLEAIKYDEENIKYIPEVIFKNPDNVYTMIVYSTSLITKIPKEYITKEIIDEVLYRLFRLHNSEKYTFVRKYIIKNFSLLRVPELYLTETFLKEYITDEELTDDFVKDLQCSTVNSVDLTKMIVKKEPKYYSLIDNKYKNKYTKDMILENPEVTRYIPKEKMTKDIVQYMIEHFVSLQYIPEEYINKRLCKAYYNHDMNEILYIPDKYVTRKMKKDLIDSFAHQYMNPEWFNRSLVKRAIDRNIQWVKYIPQKYINKKIVDRIITGNLFTLIQYCPISEETVHKAVYSNMEWIKYLPKEYITTEYIIKIIKEVGNYSLDIFDYLDESYINEEIAFTMAILHPDKFLKYKVLDKYKDIVFKSYEENDTQIKFSFNDDINKYTNYKISPCYIYFKNNGKIIGLDSIL